MRPRHFSSLVPATPGHQTASGVVQPLHYLLAGAHRHQQWGPLFLSVTSVSTLGAFSPAVERLPDPVGSVGLRLGARRFVTGLRRLTAVFAGLVKRHLISPVCQLVADATLPMNEQFRLSSFLDDWISFLTTTHATAFHRRP